MDVHTACEESYKNGYEKGLAAARDKNVSRLYNVPADTYNCIVLTENVDGERRLIMARRPFDLWEDWNKNADCCPENDAPVRLFVLNGQVICADDGWDFEEVMDRVQRVLSGDSMWQ